MQGKAIAMHLRIEFQVQVLIAVYDFLSKPQHQLLALAQINMALKPFNMAFPNAKLAKARHASISCRRIPAEPTPIVVGQAMIIERFQ